MHDGDEAAISTSENESLDYKGNDVGDVILDDNDGLSNLGEERSDVSTASEDEGSGRTKRKRDPFTKLLSTPFVNPGNGGFEFEFGQTFVDVHAFRVALRDYRVKGGYQFNKIKNDKTRMIVECAWEGCKWRLHASVLPNQNTFMEKL